MRRSEGDEGGGALLALSMSVKRGGAVFKGVPGLKHKARAKICQGPKTEMVVIDDKADVSI